MANNKKVEPKKVMPIKVEKITDTPNNNKEIFAIVVGIFLIAALIVGSVIYFRTDEDPINKPNNKKDPVIDIDPENKKDDENKKIPVNNGKNKGSYASDGLVVRNYYKCTSACPTIVVNTEKTGKIEKVKDDDRTKTEKYEFLNENNVEQTLYYNSATSDDVYRIVIKGELKTTASDLDLLTKASVQAAANRAVKKASERIDGHTYSNNKTTNEKIQTKAKEALNELTTVEDTEGLIVVADEETTVITHAVTIRIDESKGIDWKHGVTVDGKTYYEEALNKPDKDTNERPNTYTYQDENGINVVVGVNKNTLDKEVKFEVSYYTNTKGDKNSYDSSKDEDNQNPVVQEYVVDLKSVELSYFGEEDIKDEEEDSDKVVNEDEIEDLEETYETIINGDEDEEDSESIEDYVEGVVDTLTNDDIDSLDDLDEVIENTESIDEVLDNE